MRANSFWWKTLGLCCLLSLAAGAVGAEAPRSRSRAKAAEAVVRPREIKGTLINPGMGFTSFNCPANGNPSAYPQTRIAYYRFYWDEVEPEEGRFRFDVFDEIIRQAQAQGQTVAFRVMVMDTGARIPPWLMNRLRVVGQPDKWRGAWYGAGKKDFIPDFASPEFMEAVKHLIMALGKKYDGHPAIDHVDIGLIGQCGEWHFAEAEKEGYRVPGVDVRKKYIDWYFEAFPSTALIMPVAGVRDGLLNYAVGKGAGWRADGAGMPDYHQPGRRDNYRENLTRLRLQNNWKNKPVLFELGTDLQDWRRQGWSREDVRKIFDDLLAMHVSVLNLKNAAVPEEWSPILEEFSEKMGYRLVLAELRHARSVPRKGLLEIQSCWENHGVAPLYRRGYKIAYRLRQEEQVQATFNSQGQIEQCLPGSPYRVYDRLTLPKTLPAGEYSLDISIDLRPSGGQETNSKLQIAIEGKRSDGWYAVSQVTVRP